MDIIEEQLALDHLLDKWQGVMRLVDWDIEAEIVSISDLGNSDAYGENAICAHSSHSTIVVVNEKDRPKIDKDGITPKVRQTLEWTLVHELVHIWLRDLTGTETSVERAVNLITGVLIDLYGEQVMGPVLVADGGSAACN